MGGQPTGLLDNTLYENTSIHMYVQCHEAHQVNIYAHDINDASNTSAHNYYKHVLCTYTPVGDDLLTTGSIGTFSSVSDTSHNLHSHRV